MIPTDISSEAIRACATRLSSVGEDADQTLRDFQSTLESFGQVWGRDDLGMIIGEIYQAARDVMMNCYNSNLDTIDSYAERLGLAADNYDETDIAMADQLDALRSASDANFAV